MHTDTLGLSRIIRAFGYSWAGLRDVFRNEQAFRQEVYTLLVFLPLGFWLGETGVERALLMGSLLLVPIVELLNSAVEAVVDRIGPERHPLSRLAKDFGSAALLLTICLAALVWVMILAPRYF
jgi:diacylglycerol kinase (ATP)